MGPYDPTATIAVIGSRDFPNKEFVFSTLDKIIKPIYQSGWGVHLVSGGARGVDQWVEEWAKAHGTTVEVIKPINPNNKAHYLYRNIEIVCAANRLIAFWDGKSRGTEFTVDYARMRKKRVQVFKNPAEISV